MLPARLQRALAASLLCLGASMVFASCALGSRPTLGEADPPLDARPADTGNPRVDPLLHQLDSTRDKTFTATYTLTRRLGPVTQSVTVTQSPPITSLRVDDTEFLRGPDERTCTLTTGQCDVGIIEQRMGDLAAFTTNFYAASPAAQLRVSYRRRVAEPTFDKRTLAFGTGECVSINVGPGTETYCIAPNGLIAYVSRNDLLTELRELSPTADQAKVTAPTLAKP